MIQQRAFALALFLLVAFSRRTAGGAVGVVIASMMLWPEYLRIPMGRCCEFRFKLDTHSNVDP